MTYIAHIIFYAGGTTRWTRTLASRIVGLPQRIVLGSLILDVLFNHWWNTDLGPVGPFGLLSVLLTKKKSLLLYVLYHIYMIYMIENVSLTLIEKMNFEFTFKYIA